MLRSWMIRSCKEFCNCDNVIAYQSWALYWLCWLFWRDCYHSMFQYVGVVQFNESCGMSIVMARPELLAYMYMFKYFAVKTTTTLFCQLYRQRIDNVICCCMWYCCSTEATLWCWTKKPNVNTYNYSFKEFCHCDSFKAYPSWALDCLGFLCRQSELTPWWCTEYQQLLRGRMMWC